GCEVGGAVDHSIVGDEHVPNCMPATRHSTSADLRPNEQLGAVLRRVVAQMSVSVRSQPGVLPISSTPAPFQRNLTTLSKPGVPLEYTSATVSPVLSVCSMLLKP